jgi:CheY-like chemotaxis protein
MMRHSVPKSINCSKKLAEDLFTVDADLSQMHQMIMNICLNAIESMPDGGTITIETRNIRPDKTARIKYGELSPGQYVELSIKDTGGGIKKEHMPRIFEPFFTTKTTGEVRGTGLGLPAVYGIVQNHHGAIHVDSQPGKGTLVQVALPKGRLAFKGMKRTHQKITKGKGTLLVIDDDRQVREFTKKALENMGYKAITAEDGLKGIDLYKKNMPNISGVIIDMIMPKADGMKTFRQMKKINPQIKVLFATGYSKECNNGKISKLGACGIIHKPFRLKMLSDSIEKMLKG